MVDGGTNGRAGGWMIGWLDVRTDGRTDGLMCDGGMYEWTDTE